MLFRLVPTISHRFSYRHARLMNEETLSFFFFEQLKHLLKELNLSTKILERRGVRTQNKKMMLLISLLKMDL